MAGLFMRGRMNGMHWWKNRTRFDAEMHEAFATMYLIGAAVFSVFWLIDTSDWQPGLAALATIALTMYHFWRGRVQFRLRTILVFVTYAAVVIGLSSAAIHILRK